jgi:hypothetical protein
MLQILDAVALGHRMENIIGRKQRVLVIPEYSIYGSILRLLAYHCERKSSPPLLIRSAESGTRSTRCGARLIAGDPITPVVC